jgi:hypothetical protein
MATPLPLNVEPPKLASIKKTKNSRKKKKIAQKMNGDSSSLAQQGGVTVGVMK